MLKELNIKNLAIIDQLRVEFGPGLNVLTGETGAGKSIVVDALSLALGERASADLIRSGCDEAVVEAAFDLNGNGTAEVKKMLQEQGLDMADSDDLIVRRVISASGKNKVYINGSIAHLATLSSLGLALADIHGQHEHQSLLSLEHQMDLLDSFGELVPLRDAVGAEHQRLQNVRNKLAELEAGERDRIYREDMLRFQKNEIESAMLKPGEDIELANLHNVMANTEKLAAYSTSVEEILHGSDDSILANLKKVLKALKDVNAIDTRLAGAMELCESARAQLEEAAREVSSYQASVEFDPARLEQIADRVDAIKKLKKKYGETVEEIIAFGARAAIDLELMEKGTEAIEGLKSEIQAIKFVLTDKAAQLTKKRGEAALQLEKKVELELGHLGMKKCTFTVKISQDPGGDTLSGLKLGPRGADRVEFLISPNPGEEPKPLAKIASGGELSRIMLALKTVLLEGDSIPTLVFDEVDAGIGGEVAEEVGKKLKKVSTKRQVFCITHLPHIACMARSHYGVSKSVKNDRTSTEVVLLGKQEQVDEIARMLGGKSVTEATLKHAREMITRGSA